MMRGAPTRAPSTQSQCCLNARRVHSSAPDPSSLLGRGNPFAFDPISLLRFVQHANP